MMRLIFILKMMKGIFLAMVLFLALTSCERKEIYKAPVVDNLLTTTIQHIEVPEGKIAIVHYYEDTLAILTKTADVVVPKVAQQSHSSIQPISVEFLENNNNLGNAYQIWQVIAFEDSEHGDYDYNDLVIHVRIIQNSWKTEFCIHPIALGSTKTIKLGVRIKDTDVILAENCREELFEGLEGFINTDIKGLHHKYENTYKFSENIPCTYGKDVNWFIEVNNGKRLYAVSKNYPSLNSQRMAYGLIILDINDFYTFGNEKTCGRDWFNYPQEKVHINEVYPQFDLLLNSGASFKTIFSKQEEGFYPAINADENRVVTAEGCLYAITIK